MGVMEGKGMVMGGKDREHTSLASLACFSCHSFSHWLTLSSISFSLVRPFFLALARKFDSLAEVFALSGFFLR